MNQTHFAPRPITTAVVALNPALLSGDRSKLDAFADAMLARERDYQEAMAELPDAPLSESDVDRMGEDDERHTEGRQRRPFPVNIHD